MTSLDDRLMVQPNLDINKIAIKFHFFKIAIISAVLISSRPEMVLSCSASFWQNYRDTQIWSMHSVRAYFYEVSKMAIDADGAPDAYHPKDIGIDSLENSGYPFGDWKNILVPDPKRPGEPFIQKDGKFAGFFISKTSLEDKSKSLTDINRYVDSRTVPYIVFPYRFWKLKNTGMVGDFGIVLNLENNSESPAIVADIG